MSFRRIEAQKPNTNLRECVLARLASSQGVSPALMVEFLGPENTEFWNDSIARANSQLGRRGTKKISPESINSSRAENRKIIAKYAVRALVNVFHDDGNPATNADIPAFVDSLPDFVFDEVMAFAVEPTNFIDDVPTGDAETVAKK